MYTFMLMWVSGCRRGPSDTSYNHKRKRSAAHLDVHQGAGEPGVQISTVMTITAKKIPVN